MNIYNVKSFLEKLDIFKNGEEAKPFIITCFILLGSLMVAIPARLGNFTIPYDYVFILFLLFIASLIWFFAVDEDFEEYHVQEMIEMVKDELLLKDFKDHIIYCLEENKPINKRHLRKIYAKNKKQINLAFNNYEKVSSDVSELRAQRWRNRMLKMIKDN